MVDGAGENAAADGEMDLQVLDREERLRAFGDGLRVGGVVAFFPRMADPGEFGFGMQESAAAGGFEVRRRAASIFFSMTRIGVAFVAIGLP